MSYVASRLHFNKIWLLLFLIILGFSCQRVRSKMMIRSTGLRPLHNNCQTIECDSLRDICVRIRSGDALVGFDQSALWLESSGIEALDRLMYYKLHGRAMPAIPCEIYIDDLMEVIGLEPRFAYNKSSIDSTWFFKVYHRSRIGERKPMFEERKCYAFTFDTSTFKVVDSQIYWMH